MSPHFENNVEPEWFRKRLNLVFIWISIAFLILGARLFWLQVVNGEKYRKLSLNNRIRVKRVPPSRGLIYDRHNKLIVDNRPSFNIKVVPSDVKSIDDLVGKLRKVVDIEDKTVEKLKSAVIYTPFKSITLASDVDRRVVGIIESNQFFLQGAYISVEPKRQYLYPGIASHVVGYLGEADTDFLRKRGSIPLRVGDYVGKSGIEKQYEDYLRGQYGGAQVEVNARGKVMQVLNKVDSVPGDNIVLTIDLELQSYAMELLKGEAGSIVAMDPKTGEVLCMASSPSYDENMFVTGMSEKEWKTLIKNPDRPLQNKAIQGKYPPGSVYKMIPAIAGLEESIISGEDKYFCSGRYYYGDRFFRCWNKYGHGNITIKEALVHSCDVYFYKLGNKLGIEKLAEYARKFGLGQKTGIEIENEEAGLVPDAKWKRKRFKRAWQGGETLSVVIGQGYNLVTPLQMAVMTCAIANGGYLVKPLLIKKITDSKGQEIQNVEKKVIKDLKFDKKNIKIVQDAMVEVVNTHRGTASRIKSAIVKIAGKTGTAQVVSSEKYKKNKKSKKARKRWMPHAWFVAYADAASPEIAVAVLVEHGEHGSTIAAPIAKKIIEKYYGNKTK